MAEQSVLDAAVTRLAEVTGWSEDKATKHVAGLANELATKAEQRARAAAQKTLDKRRPAAAR